MARTIRLLDSGCSCCLYRPVYMELSQWRSLMIIVRWHLETHKFTKSVNSADYLQGNSIHCLWGNSRPVLYGEARLTREYFRDGGIGSTAVRPPLAACLSRHRPTFSAERYRNMLSKSSLGIA